MFMKATTIEKFSLKAQDGEMGKAKDLYFNEQTYTVRYLTVESKKWFPDQIIYLSPSAIDHIDFEKNVIKVNNTKDELREVAGVKHESEMNHQREQELTTSMNWNQYWVGDEVWGRHATPLNSTSDVKPSSVVTDRTDHLRSVNHMKGVFNHANVIAEDGDMGYVADVIIEKETWRIRYFVINCGKWSTHQLTLISPDWITSANWTKDEFYVDMTLEGIEKGPLYQKRKPITRDFEERMYHNYGKEPYWS